MLPNPVQMMLSIIHGKPLDELAAAADTVLETLSSTSLSTDLHALHHCPTDAPDRLFINNLRHEVEPCRVSNTTIASPTVAFERPCHTFAKPSVKRTYPFVRTKLSRNKYCSLHANFGANAIRCRTPYAWKTRSGSSHEPNISPLFTSASKIDSGAVQHQKLPYFAHPSYKSAIPPDVPQRLGTKVKNIRSRSRRLPPDKLPPPYCGAFRVSHRSLIASNDRQKPAYADLPAGEVPTTSFSDSRN